MIAAGGTAGHVVPAIAVADALRAEGAEVSFLGTRERAEAELVPAAGYEIDFLRVSGLDRRNPLKAARAAGRPSARWAPPADLLRAAARRGRAGRWRLRGGPGGAGGRPDGPAAGAHRGRQPPGPRQPPARPPRPARLPCIPDPGPGRRPLSAHRQAGPARGARGRPDGRPPPLRHPGTRGLRDGRRRQPRRPLDQLRRLRRLQPPRGPARPRRPAVDPPRRRPSRLRGAAPALGRGGPTRALHVAAIRAESWRRSRRR